jgi:peroxiredoxin
MSASDSLAGQIAALQAEMIPNIPQDTLSTMMSATQTLADSRQAEKALNVGDVCPDFELGNAHGVKVRLSEQLKSGPAVISFYRGAWCPYCNLEIHALKNNLDTFRQHGADLIAISPQVPDKSLPQVNDLDLEFEVLSDIGNEIAKQFGLVFTVSPELRPIYDTFGIDIADHNGDNNFEIPMPATYIVDSGRKIRFGFVSADYTQRLEPSIIIEELQKL